MKKILIFSLCLCFCNADIVSDEQKFGRSWQADVGQASSDNQSDKEMIVNELYYSDNPNLLRIFSKSLNNLKDKYPSDRECEYFFDPITNSNEADFNEIRKTLKISSLQNGNVVATFTNFGEKNRIEYVFDCQNICVVDDILINDEKFSYKKSLKDCINQE